MMKESNGYAIWPPLSLMANLLIQDYREKMQDIT